MPSPWLLVHDLSDGSLNSSFPGIVPSCTSFSAQRAKTLTTSLWQLLPSELSCPKLHQHFEPLMPLRGWTSTTKNVTGCSQCGTYPCEGPREWTATNCSDFRVMKIAKFAKYLGKMIGPEGCLHRWTAPRNKFNSACAQITTSPKILVERLSETKSMHFLCWAFLGSVAAPEQATNTDESRALQRLAAGSMSAGSTQPALL